jgi:isoleucyl-tRNA synthetase
VKERLLDVNEEVNWYPDHIKHGRYGDWLENNVDWALSRERYWGTPLPVWRCENGHLHCVGSFAELEELSGAALDDHHRPFVDDVGFPCAQCGEPMTRVPEVIDAWFDSGSMPFAQHHAPFESKERFDAHFPADFICEALDQTRGWFYSPCRRCCSTARRIAPSSASVCSSTARARRCRSPGATSSSRGRS